MCWNSISKSWVLRKGLQANETAYLCHENTELLKTFNIDTTYIRPKTSKGVLPQVSQNCQQDLEWTEGGCGLDSSRASRLGVSWSWLLGESGETEKGYKEVRETKGQKWQGNSQLCSKNYSHKLVSIAASLSRFLPPASSLSLHDLHCKLCECIVDRPVKTPCSNLACAEDISSLVFSAHAAGNVMNSPPQILQYT